MMKNSEQPVLKQKITFLGDIKVGKTSIINKFVNGHMSQTYEPTIGMDFISKNIFLEEFTVRLQIWDTSGQERFRSLIPSYVKDSSAAILCYDVEDLQSFQNLPRWLDFVKGELNIPTFLIANKLDVNQNRIVTLDQGVQFAKYNNMIYYECSAQNGTNIGMIFHEIAKITLDYSKRITKEPTLQIQSKDVEQSSEFKLVFLGDEAVGKTSIRFRFISNALIETYNPTLGVDFESKSVIISGNKVLFQILEISSNNKFKNWISSFIKSDAVVICYDVTNSNSFQSVPIWIASIKKNDHDDKIYVLIANKVDAKQGRVISQDVGIQFAHDNNMLYFETSIYDEVGIQNMFQELGSKHLELTKIKNQKCK